MFLRELQKTCDTLVNEVEELGFNPGVLAAEIPVAEHVERDKDKEEQVKRLLAHGAHSLPPQSLQYKARQRFCYVESAEGADGNGGGEGGCDCKEQGRCKS